MRERKAEKREKEEGKEGERGHFFPVWTGLGVQYKCKALAVLKVLTTGGEGGRKEGRERC